MSRHRAKLDFWPRFWTAIGTIAMFLSILVGSVIIGLSIAWVIIRETWLGGALIVTVCVALGIPAAVIVAKWPYWAANRQARRNTIEFDFEGLKPGQAEYYRALLNSVDPRDRKMLLNISDAMEKVKRTNFVRDVS